MFSVDIERPECHGVLKNCDNECVEGRRRGQNVTVLLKDCDKECVGNLKRPECHCVFVKFLSPIVLEFLILPSSTSGFDWFCSLDCCAGIQFWLEANMD